jgi:prepilin-type N-terminal cleavage/methylation domain-containing protein
MKNINQKGFTFIEVLIAVLLTSVVLGAIYGTFFLAQRAKEQGGDSMLRLYEAQKIMDTLRRELEAVKGGVEIRDKEYFGKQASGVSFITFSPKRGILTKMDYSIKEDNGALSMEKKEDYLPNSAAAIPAHKAVLLEQIDEFIVEVNSGGKWVKTYSGTGRPSSMRVTLKVPFKGRLFTLSEIVTPRIGKTL